MTLTDEQKKQVAAWLDEGAKPADVQTRLDTQFGIRATYMEIAQSIRVQPASSGGPWWLVPAGIVTVVVLMVVVHRYMNRVKSRGVKTRPVKSRR